MSASVSVVIPVKDGARWLTAVLTAVRTQDPAAELLVIDSGSCDGSPQLARDAGARVVSIAPADFGHGRTRNLGAESTTGELICFLTQDAEPLPGWLDAHREAMSLDPRVGACYGPHLPRADTSPMIARELTSFFDAMSPDGGPVLQGEGDEPFLSNVNACYRRACWEQLHFADIPYAEDQAFARAMLAAGWLKSYHPGAGVLHAHDYGPVDFMRRYFDEYRGLRQATGHIQGFAPRDALRQTLRETAADERWMRAQGWSAARRAAWTARAVVHHGGKRAFAALGSYADRLPAPVERRISLERRASAAPPRLPAEAPAPIGELVAPRTRRWFYDDPLAFARQGPVSLLDPVPGQADRDRLHIAVVIPPFRRGSGGHSTIYNLLTRLEDRGHTVTTWMHDPLGQTAHDWPARVAGDLREYFRPTRGPVFKGFEHWYGADVVLATGWETVFPVLRLDHARARAYLVQDHEPEFYATSAESMLAELTYGLDVLCIAASPWLRDVVSTRYGAQAVDFELGVDRDVYRPRPLPRRSDTVVFYARSVTPRRAVPLGLMALAEIKRRRPDVRIVLFGDLEPTDAPFEYEHLGIASPDELARLYTEATVGLSLSLTNYSLVPQEMLACGLPVVELAGGSVESVYGADGPIELTAIDVMAIAEGIDRLLSDPELRARRSAEGIEFVSALTWERAADQLEDGLRQALRRETVGAAPAAADAGRRRVRHDLSRSVTAEPVVTAGASARVLARLDATDVAAIEAALTDDERGLLAAADHAERCRLLVVLGAWHGIEAIFRKGGLTAAMPPDDVHSMARGHLAAGGSFYYADMLDAVMRRAGASLDDVRRGLDFGCSSGRVVRALQAAWPDAEWHGVDPNADAIAWASEALPQTDFAVSPLEPPLDFPDERFDLVVAISIWSHFAEGAASRWLAEMHRIVRPGGHLVLTTHGPQSIDHYATTGGRAVSELEQIRRALYSSGYWFAPEFGTKGDWGVKHPDWGGAFSTPEWLARTIQGRWSIEDYGTGLNALNQDVYTLRRR